MLDLNDIAVFVRVARLGSFSRAAHALGMPVSTVSRRISVLEEELGVTLLQRTTRKLSLTDQGRAYLDQCGEPLAQLCAAESVLTQTQKQPEGLLRISVPVVFGKAAFHDFLSDFMKAYPLIKVDLYVTNIFLDLIAENIDLAIRFGELRDSTLVAQRIGRSVRYLVATPPYLADRAPLKSPDDLIKHDCIMLNGRNNEAEWHLVKGRRHARMHVHGPFSGHDFESVSAFVYRGHGVGLMPSVYCDEKIASGDLVRLLPDWSSPEILIYAVYPTRRYMPSRLYVFLDALRAWAEKFFSA
ncbi:LysR family transcriptional regulator [Dyella dinghuensis]|uniref:LysR family transcriptional regulator n=1 Tax=Dyella dinghuensis TaxID=1920169 RepID=A0A3S0S241_9GAMM|nr:LysR family transcriptional regulator [Dyella dinghuensis]RUL62231.1 LysR family transcriptional regulator [Dyella dinghuensis]